VITAANLAGFDLQQNFFFAFFVTNKSRGNRMGKGFARFQVFRYF